MQIRNQFALFTVTVALLPTIYADDVKKDCYYTVWTSNGNSWLRSIRDKTWSDHTLGIHGASVYFDEDCYPHYHSKEILVRKGCHEETTIPK